MRRYADPEPGWWRCDHLQRQLEEAAGGDDHGIPALLGQARAAYQAFAADLAEGFGASLSRSGVLFGDLLPQTDIFHRLVEPDLARERVAYVLVDALRYELGLDLAQRLAAELEPADLEVRPAIAAAPTVTEVGMAALLPRAERGLGLSGERGRFGAVLDGRVLRVRADRRKFLSALLGEQVLDLRLREVRAGRKWRERAAEARLVIVWQQAMDKEGEQGQDETDFASLARDLDDVVHAVRRLGDAGFARVVIAADHGTWSGVSYCCP